MTALTITGHRMPYERWIADEIERMNWLDEDLQLAKENANYAQEIDDAHGGLDKFKEYVAKRRYELEDFIEFAVATYGYERPAR